MGRVTKAQQAYALCGGCWGGQYAIEAIRGEPEWGDALGLVSVEALKRGQGRVCFCGVSIVRHQLGWARGTIKSGCTVCCALRVRCGVRALGRAPAREQCSSLTDRADGTRVDVRRNSKVSQGILALSIHRVRVHRTVRYRYDMMTETDDLRL